MSLPIWITESGFLGTLTEQVSVSIPIYATGTTITYELISGSLPSGISLSNTGIISGTPSLVYVETTNKFVIRAKNAEGANDRTFHLNTLGPTAPVWTTPTINGALEVGPIENWQDPLSEPYIINRQHINFQLSATTDILPPGKSLFYFIADNDGQLPPGITLTNTGNIIGFVNDQTIVDYTTTVKSRYAADPYDKNPYDFEGINSSIGGTTYYNKVYQFYVTVTDGVAESKQVFKINVKDPAFLTDKLESPVLDPAQTYIRNPVPPQWLINTNLPTIRSNNRFILPLTVYDPYPGTGSVVYSAETPLPEHFTLNTGTGIVVANLPYSSAFLTEYNFSITATKTFRLYATTTATTATFTMTVLGDDATYINFVTPDIVGVLTPNEISELYLEVSRVDGATTTYALISGELPPGITLETDGTIVGKIPYDSTATTVLYEFEVRAEDVQRRAYVIKTFSITVDRSDETEYTSIMLRPFLQPSVRDTYYDFTSDPNIFDQSLMYRPYDQNFGVQKTIQMALYTGIETTSLRNYANAMQQYFFKKQLFFGEVKSAVAKQPDGTVIYEIVYVDIVDNTVNNDGISVSSTVTSFGSEINTNSINAMRGALENVDIDGNIIQYTTFFLPLYQKTVQLDTGIPLNFVKSVPICYVKPGNSATVIKKITESGFKFNMINFEIDRIIVLNSTHSDQQKYLMFPKVISPTAIDTEHYLYGMDGLTIDTEDGVPLLTEF